MDLILLGKAVWPGKGLPRGEAVAIQGGKVAAVGSREAILALRRPTTRVVDAGEGFIMPGFIDSHLHLFMLGKLLHELDLTQVGSIAELVAKVKEAPGEGWIFGHGWDDARFAEGRLPHRKDVDPATGERPLLLRRRCGHVALANTAALKAAGVWPGQRELPPSLVDLDEEGIPTGILREGAIAWVAGAMPSLSRSQWKGYVRKGALEAARVGITTLHSNDGSRHVYPTDGHPSFEDVEAIYGELAEEGLLPVRVSWDFPIELLEEAKGKGVRTGQPVGTSPLFLYGEAKIFTDGSLGGRTAALLEPYSDDPGNRGLLLWDDESLEEAVEGALRAGIGVCIHAIGDAAAEQVLRTVAEVRKTLEGEGLWGRGPRAVFRPRLIHCQIMEPSQFSRMAALGMVGDVQPRFVKSDLPIIEKRVGPERGKSSYAWKSLLRAGVPLAFSSDCPIEPLNPLEGVQAAVLRQDEKGEPKGGWQPEEKLSLEEALHLYTYGGAYALGAEGERGRLLPGESADLVILDRDPFEVDPEELSEIRVLATYLMGERTYGEL
ncbi:MAG: amidohydrolase [Clostridiales bacterium]|nr:amidohydrolase [Clostridiales bacterium]